MLMRMRAIFRALVPGALLIACEGNVSNGTDAATEAAIADDATSVDAPDIHTIA